MQLSSSAFSNGTAIPHRFTCEERTSPHLLTGKLHRRRPAVSSSSATIRTRPPANGTIGPFTTSLLNKQGLPKAPATTAARRD